MNIFLRPTVFKVITTLIMLLVAFGTPFLDSFTLTFSENSMPQQLNLPVKILNVIRDIMYYPIRFLLGPFTNITMNPAGQVNNLNYAIFITIIYVIFVVVESYLIGCIISALVSKKWK